MEGANLRELSKTKILYILSLIFSFVFFFLSVGILIGDGANLLVPYISLTIAVALSLATLIVSFFRNQRTVGRPQRSVFQQTDSQPVTPTIEVPSTQVPKEEPVVVASPAISEQIDATPAKSEEIVQKAPNNYGEEKIEPIEQLVTLPVDNQQTPETVVAQPIIEAKAEDQKIIEPAEQTPIKRNAVKSTPTKKTAPKRAKTNTRKTK